MERKLLTKIARGRDLSHDYCLRQLKKLFLQFNAMPEFVLTQLIAIAETKHPQANLLFDFIFENATPDNLSLMVQ